MPGHFLYRLASVLRYYSCKEVIGSPEFPSFPCKRMPRPKTPVVSTALASSLVAPWTAAFRTLRRRRLSPAHHGFIPLDHDYTSFRGSTSQPAFSRFSQLYTPVGRVCICDSLLPCRLSSGQMGLPSITSYLPTGKH
jgi:hypothetical protein